jgi:hypothetical protein
VYPSAPEEARYASPATDPRLRLRSNSPSDDEVASWSAAVVRALTTPVVKPDAPFRALEALHDVFALFGEGRAPANPREKAMLDSMPHADAIVMLAAATEDASEAKARLYHQDNGGQNGRVYLTDVIVPRDPGAPVVPPVACRESGPATPRFAAWLGGDHSSSTKFWPCDDPPPPPPPIERRPCNPGCQPGPVHASDGTCTLGPLPKYADGRVRCRVEARYGGDDPCPAEYGWLDPAGEDGGRAPRYEEEAGVKLRVCEIRQLEGAALTACRTSLSCDGCEPGWCFTEVPELFPMCCEAEKSSTTRFRFVRGAGENHSGEGRITCDRDPSP